MDRELVSSRLRDGDVSFIAPLIELPDFMSSCVDEKPSQYHIETWRKRGTIRVQYGGIDLYFTLVFSKTPNCFRIITMFPDRDGPSRHNFSIPSDRFCTEV